MASAPERHAARPRPTAPGWCREPHRLLFPLGAALGVVAVLPFLFGGAGGGSLALFHSVAQIQGFLTCFVVGFLLTLIPRHTRTLPAAPWEVVSALVLPTFAVFCAWMGEPAVSGWLWLLLLVVVMVFTTTRIRARPESVQFVPVLLWVPASIAAGALGAVLVLGGPGLGMPYALQAWIVGRGLLVQGFITGLVLGIGGYLLPLVARGEAPAPALDRDTYRRRVALHAAAAFLFFASFGMELVTGPRVGFTLRALISGAVLVGSARIHRGPLLPGLHRRLIWLGAWLVPAAFLLGATAPRFRGAALHVLFVGGFAQITLAVSSHVVLWRENRPAELRRNPLAMGAMAVLLGVAFCARIAAAIDLRRVAGWLEVAAYAFCAAVAAWAAVVLPPLLAGGSAPARVPPARGS